MSILRVSPEFIAGMLHESIEIWDGDQAVRIERDAIPEGAGVAGARIANDGTGAIEILIDDGAGGFLMPRLCQYSAPVGKRREWVKAGESDTVGGRSRGISRDPSHQ